MMARLGVSPLRSHYPRVPVEPRAAGETGRTDRAGGEGERGDTGGTGPGVGLPPGRWGADREGGRLLPIPGPIARAPTPFDHPSPLANRREWTRSR